MGEKNHWNTKLKNGKNTMKQKVGSLKRLGFPGGSSGKESACIAGNPGSILGSGRFPGEEHGNPLQYSCLENPMDRGAWWVTVHGVAELVMIE